MDKEALDKFLVKGLFPTGREVGRGAFGKVEEVEIPGAVCAAKRIHDELLRTEDAADLTQKFVRECKLMSRLRHPHIVQFLGICYLPDSADVPSLVMEKLDCDLHRLLETDADFPLTVKKSILTDVANGLVYLHSQNPSIVHRDLTARNVLLSSAMRAKIGDMGVARIVNLSPGKLTATMSRGPGNIVYMAPEAMEDHPKYNTALDVFSFGNLIVFTLTQLFPVLKGATYVASGTNKLYPRSEIERRTESFNQLERQLGDENHPLISLAKHCLQNVPDARPTAHEVVSRLNEVVLVPCRLWDSNKVEMIRDVLASETETRRKGEQWRDGQVVVGLDDRQHVNGREEQNGHSEHKSLKQETPGLTSHDQSEHNPSPLTRTHLADEKQPVAIESVTWRKGKRMPKKMESASSVITNGNVFVGSERTVLSYSLVHDVWTELPKPPQREFSMTVLNNRLVLVGGLGVNVYGMFSHDQTISDKLSVWDTDERKWTHPFPNLPNARYNACSAGYEGYLVVAGGRKRMPEDSSMVTSQIEVPSLSTVDILDSSALKWYSVDPLPFECHAMQASVIGDKLYLVGGRNRFDLIKAVVWASLPNLITSRSVLHDPSLPATNLEEAKTYAWNVLPPCPCFAPTVPFCPATRNQLTEGDSHQGNCQLEGDRVPLLALGGLPGLQLSLLGELDTPGIVIDIHAYSHSANRWVKVGEMPEACVGCSCSLLPSTGELFVTGGGQFRSPLNSVYFGKIQTKVND